MRRFAVLALLLFAGPSNADQPSAFCENYGQTAAGDVWASILNTGYIDRLLGNPDIFGGGAGAYTSCGFSGPRWDSASPYGHREWCTGQSEATVNAEEAARVEELKFCGICRQYVAAALKAEASGRAGHCPLSGLDWPGTGEGMMQWCMRRNHDNLQTLTQRLKTILSDAKDGIDACEAARLRAKLSVPREPSLADKARVPHGTLSDTPCRWCKSKSAVTGAPQQGGGSAMDRLGDLNNSNLGTVSGSAGGAEIGRPATPRPTTPTTSAPPSADSVVRAPARSNTDTNSGFRSKPTPTFPTFNDSNTIR